MNWPVVIATAAAFLAGAAPARAADPAAKLEVGIGLLARAKPAPATFDVDPVPQDEGVQGARLGLKDNNTTGAFTGQHYTVDEVMLSRDQSPVEEARKLADKGDKFLVADLGADDLLAVADALKDRGVVVFNVAAQDDRLRGADCRADLWHTAPSRAMLADALMEFLSSKRWANLFLIVGPTPADQLYAQAIRDSARKFGLKIAAEKPWTFGALARARADSVTQADALVITRGTDYDIMVVADEAGDFGDYIPYHTWDPRLVAGTQGLVAASWHPTHNAWGAEQLQSRFSRLAKRPMRPIDYQAWMAVRAIGEAVTRVKTDDAKAIDAFMLGGDFGLAAFKGIAVSFRPWDRQLRQPLLIAQPRALVGVSPQPGFLHERTPLDTLGVDEPETKCHLN